MERSEDNKRRSRSSSPPNGRDSLRKSRSLSPPKKIPLKVFTRQLKSRVTSPEAVRFQNLDELRDCTQACDNNVLNLGVDVQNRYTDVIAKYRTPPDELVSLDKSKNRSNENLPTRAGLLTVLDIPYINASLIKYRSMRYIATQHPMENTIIDFWKMILLEQPALILMLNGYEYRKEQNLDESLRTHPQYWPDTEQTIEFLAPEGRILVSRIGEPQHLKEISIIHLRVTLNDDAKIWTGWHVCYYSWPDQEKPDIEEFITLWKIVQEKIHETHNKKMVVHCTGGIGRTGTYITIDIAARKISESLEGSVSIDEIILMLREYRNNMVGHSEQYVFCHKAPLKLIEYLPNNV